MEFYTQESACRELLNRMAPFEGTVHLNVDVDLHRSGTIGLGADSANFLYMVYMEVGGGWETTPSYWYGIIR